MKLLSHLTVLDLTVNVPGPFCSMNLCDLGGRVITVEPPAGDPLRHSTGMWAALNRGKESISLDLKTSVGHEILHSLVESADIVLEGWRPGVAKRLGADYETLSKINPRLVYCSISGFGQEGPWKNRPGHDLNYLALSGYLGVQSSIEGKPWPPAILISDLAAGMYATISVLAAMSASQVRGEGTYIDLSMAEAVLSLLGPEISHSLEDACQSKPNVSGIPHYGLFECADGRWLSLGIVHEDHFWSRFCTTVGLEEFSDLKFAERLRLATDVELAIRNTLRTRTAEHWEGLLVNADVPAASVIELNEVLESTQFAFRNVFTGPNGYRFTSYPARFSMGTTAVTGHPPKFAQHTAALLTEHGYNQKQVSKFIEDGVAVIPSIQISQ
ncbi:MAG: CaiB/BaiF CoA-transferase family protein [SAR202 cluster bacterium]|nr:CaiB/BaiF CoA-transferase family protein [SAR202 cluster bacterium]